MTALFVSTSIISWSSATTSPGLTLISTTVASAIDSPNCGMMIGTCGINLFSKKILRFCCNCFCVRTMRRPQIWMIRNRCVLRVDALRRGIEQMETFARHPRDHFCRRAAPGKRFADAKQASGAGDGGKHSIGVERFNRAKIDNFYFKPFTSELFGDRETFM